MLKQDRVQSKLQEDGDMQQEIVNLTKLQFCSQMETSGEEPSLHVPVQMIRKDMVILALSVV